MNSTLKGCQPLHFFICFKCLGMKEYYGPEPFLACLMACLAMALPHKWLADINPHVNDKSTCRRPSKIHTQGGLAFLFVCLDPTRPPEHGKFMSVKFDCSGNSPWVCCRLFRFQAKTSPAGSGCGVVWTSFLGGFNRRVPGTAWSLFLTWPVISAD